MTVAVAAAVRCGCGHGRGGGAHQRPDDGLTRVEQGTPYAATSAAEHLGLILRSHTWLGEWTH
eukprot:5728884-Prymnesium_polylepis.1